MIIGIHQPNFFCYSGLLEKIRQCDVFVFLSQAQFVKGNYHNRFELGGKWYTMSVNHGIEPLCQKRYVNQVKDWSSIKSKLPMFKEELSLFDELIGEDLVTTNIAVARRLCWLLKISTRIELDYQTDLTGTDRLVDLCQAYKADCYLSGSSGPNYLELNKFESKGIQVLVQDPISTPRLSALEWIRSSQGVIEVDGSNG